MTKLMECTCNHKFQQEKYGSKRVHNSFKTSSGTGWRCTSCLKEKVEKEASK